MVVVSTIIIIIIIIGDEAVDWSDDGDGAAVDVLNNGHGMIIRMESSYLTVNRRSVLF